MTVAELQAQLLAHRSAWGTVLGWAEAARSLEALRLALAHGLLDPATGAVRPTDADLPADTVRELLSCLVAIGVLQPSGADGLELTGAFAPLFSPSAPQRLETLLGREEAVLSALRDSGGADRARALALGSGFDPEGPLAPAAAQGILTAFPELARRWATASRHLELGCGAASQALGLLRVFPQLRVVGVELDPAAGAQAAERARRLGLDGRFQLRLGDAQRFEDAAPFDSAQWSQQFFPASARAGTCAAAFRALRPGGLLAAPTFGPTPEPARATPALLGSATMRLAFARMGAQPRSEEEVAAELTDAGFALERVVALTPGPYLFARSIVLVRKPG